MKVERGSQVLVGAKDPKEFRTLSFQMPKEDPVTDAEVAQILERVAEVQSIVAPHKRTVDNAKAVCDALEDGVRRCFEERYREAHPQSGEHQRTFMEIIPPERETRDEEPKAVGEIAGKVVDSLKNGNNPHGQGLMNAVRGAKSITVSGGGRSVTLKKGRPRSAMAGGKLKRAKAAGAR